MTDPNNDTPKPTDPVLAKLTAEIKRIETDPKYLNTPGTYPRYTKAGTRRLAKLDRAVTDRLRELREERGEKINEAGYTGRQTNRRR